jgi:hypothetical protein
MKSASRDTRHQRSSSETEVHASLTLLGVAIPHDTITRQLRIQPSRMWRKGDKRAPAAVFEEDGWRFATSPTLDGDFTPHVRSVLRKIRMVRRAFVRITTEFDLEVEITCVSYGRELMPWFVLAPADLRLMAEVKACFSIDLM